MTFLDADDVRLPFRAARDLADAGRVLAACCAQQRPLLDAPASADARLLRALCALDAALRGGTRCLAADADGADWQEILELSARAMSLHSDVRVFRLAVEVGAHQLDIGDVVHCIHAAAVAALMALYLNT
ncbi:MAG: hypothetical protein WCP53_00240 [Verrucomicrobiota bacterium]